jgi:uncharacterized protein (TIGR00725 family)
VFGSARLTPEDPRYEEARQVGERLARAGYAIATGGYGGLMEAVSHGASRAGGHVVGVPMRSWSWQAPNRWISETRWAEDIFQRLRAFHACDALVALPGGLGTLSEVTLVWANRGTDPDRTPPLLLLGPVWAEMHDHFQRLLVIDKRDLMLVQLVPTIDQIIPALEQALGRRRSTSVAQHD